MNDFNNDDENNEEEYDFGDFSEYPEGEDDSDDDDLQDMEPLDSELRSAIPLDLISRWKETEFNLKISEINLALLKTAIAVSSNSWFWRFRSVDSKIKKIAHTYQGLNLLIDNNSTYIED